MRKYCITETTEVAYDLMDDTIVVGNTRIKKENCKGIILSNGGKIFIEVENKKNKKIIPRKIDILKLSP